MKRIFISHSCKDHLIVDGLKKLLYYSEWELVIDPFSPGDKTCTKVQNCIKDSTHFILLCTSNALESYWVELESLFAQLCFNQDAIIYLPISVNDTRIPESARELIYLNFYTDRDWNNTAEKLINAINESDPTATLISDADVSERKKEDGRAFERLHAETNDISYLRQAISSYESSINYNFCNHNAWANLAWCLQKSYENNRALKTIDIAMHIAPDSNHVKDVRDRIYAGKRRIGP